MTALPAPTLARGPWLDADAVRRLGEGHVLVIDGFLGAATAVLAADALRALDLDGALTPAALGRARLHRPEIRGDRTAWYSEVDLPDGLRPLWPAFEGLRQLLNQEAWLGLRRFELQLACYPGHGERYAAHTDTFIGDPARRATAVLYLNPAWEPAHGGCLRAWTPDGDILVEPVLDRLVVFRSDAVRHEVLPAFAPRLAATAWLLGSEAEKL